MLRVALPLVALTICCAGAFAQSSHRLSVPNVADDTPIQIRVAYIEFSRFPTISRETLSRLIDASTNVAKDKFGIEIRISELVILNADAVAKRMREMPEQITINELSRSYTLGSSKISLKHVLEMPDSIEQCLRNNGIPLKKLVSFVQLPEEKNFTYQELAEYLTAVAVKRYELIANDSASDGLPVVGGTPYNEWKMWQVLGYSNLPYEVVITNQPILSIERDHCSIHALLRGGLSIGGTTYSKKSKFGTYALFSIFPFVAENKGFLELNRGKKFTASEIGEYAGAYLVHEYGHMLFHLGHPFARDECVMNPAPDLNVRAWWASRSRGKCPIGSSPQMIPGAAQLSRIEYENSNKMLNPDP